MTRAARPCSLHRLLLTGVLLTLAGCLAGHRKPLPPELAIGRATRIDLSAPPRARVSAEVETETVARLINHLAEQPTQELDPELPRYNVLVLSGGGMYGAFAAGVLAGWAETGTRPQFDCVTGVSTGALVATLAFLGPEYDETLRRIAFSVNAGKIYRMRRPISILWSASVASSEPLAKLIAAVADETLLRAVARAHAAGRRLYVGTTNLESRRLVVWDMGAIASRGDADALKLFRTVLLASCSIPGFFPPVPIDVEIDGQKYSELHVDGGASASLFLRLPEMSPELAAKVKAAADRGQKPLAGCNLYIVMSGKLYADPAPVRLGFLPVAGSSLTSLLYSQARGDLYSVFTGTVLSGIRYHLTAIPQEFLVNPDSTAFDPTEMNRLYDKGVEVGKARAWQRQPPGPEKVDQLLPRAGVRFALPEKAGAAKP